MHYTFYFKSNSLASSLSRPIYNLLYFVAAKKSGRGEQPLVTVATEDLFRDWVADVDPSKIPIRSVAFVADADEHLRHVTDAVGIRVKIIDPDKEKSSRR